MRSRPALMTGEVEMRAKFLFLFTLLFALPACSFSYSLGGPPATPYAAVNGPGKPARRVLTAARPTHAAKPAKPAVAPSDKPTIEWAGDLNKKDDKPTIEWAGDLTKKKPAVARIGRLPGQDKPKPKIEWAGDLTKAKADPKPVGRATPKIEWAGDLSKKKADRKPVGRATPKIKWAPKSFKPAARRGRDAAPPIRS